MMFPRIFPKPTKYSRREEDNEHQLDSETLLSSSSSTSLTLNPSKEKHQKRDSLVALKTFVLCSVFYLSVAVWIAISLQLVRNPDDFCLHHISQYSPLVKEVKPRWHEVRFNGSFLHENIYRQSASPDVDAAWEALGVNYRGVVIPDSEAERTGLRKDQVRISEEYGGGYPANVEGLHHLHCLNLLRKTLKWNYDYYKEKGDGPFVNSEYIVRYHTTHCLDILRQQLMCVADVGVLGQVWWRPGNDSAPLPFVDFNTRHRCRDFEAVRAWAEAHQLPPETEVDMSGFYRPPEPGQSIYAEIP